MPTGRQQLGNSRHRHPLPGAFQLQPLVSTDGQFAAAGLQPRYHGLAHADQRGKVGLGQPKGLAEVAQRGHALGIFFIEYSVKNIPPAVLVEAPARLGYFILK